MKCVHCGHRYEANYTATYPGGYSPPGHMLIVTAIMFVIAVVLFVASVPIWKWAALVTLAISAGATLGCRKACKGPGGFSPVGGETCPKCGGKNKVKLWSF